MASPHWWTIRLSLDALRLKQVVCNNEVSGLDSMKATGDGTTVDRQCELGAFARMEETVTGQGVLKLGASRIPFAFTVPRGPCAAESLLPEVWRMAGQIIDHAVARPLSAGRTISCAKGCGACCRQMVPLTPPESRHVAAIVDALPPERAAIIRQRFAQAQAQLANAGVRPAGHPDDDKSAYRAYGLAYFRQGIPCPFLEEESCSIHAIRPLVCREYLVTSDPAACEALGSGRVRQVPIPVRVWAAFGRSQAPDGSLTWSPLIDALTEAEAHPAASEPPRTGPERTEAFLRELQS